MKLVIPIVLGMLAVMSVAATAPAARAVTLDHLTVSITISGQTATSTLTVADVNNDGVVTLTVGSFLLSQVKSAFGTTTFAFPGSFTGTFTVNGFSTTVTLSSTDTFTLKLVAVP